MFAKSRENEMKIPSVFSILNLDYLSSLFMLLLQVLLVLLLLPL